MRSFTGKSWSAMVGVARTVVQAKICKCTTKPFEVNSATTLRRISLRYAQNATTQFTNINDTGGESYVLCIFQGQSCKK